MRWRNQLRRASRAFRETEEEKQIVGAYDGGAGPVDSSQWKQPVASVENGEPVPPPAPMEQTSGGMQRTPTPDPYAEGSPDVRRNFGRG